MPARRTLTLLALAAAVAACRDAQIDAFQMQVGDCFDDTGSSTEEITELPGMPCAEEHDNEVYALFDLDEPAWPGDDRVTELANQGCYERFEVAIGRDYQESVLTFTTLTPSQDSWEQLGDREVVCIAYHMEFDKLTGSVLGSGM